MDLQWILQNASQVKDVLFSIFSEESQEDVAQIKEKMDEMLDLVFDLMREPAAELGLTVERSRGFLDPVKQQKLTNRLESLANILPYESEKEDMA